MVGSGAPGERESGSPEKGSGQHGVRSFWVTLEENIPLPGVHLEEGVLLL